MKKMSNSKKLDISHFEKEVGLTRFGGNGDILYSKLHFHTINEASLLATSSGNGGSIFSAGCNLEFTVDLIHFVRPFVETASELALYIRGSTIELSGTMGEIL